MKIRISLPACAVAVVLGWTGGWALARWLPRPVPVVSGKHTEELCNAASAGDEQTIRALLDDADDPNAAESHGFMPLHIAAGNGKVEVVKSLLAHHANVNGAAEDGVTSLHLAALRGDLGIMKMLLAQHADPEARTSDQFTPLCWAVGESRAEAVQCLLRHQARLDAADDEGNTALHLAANSLSKEVAEPLRSSNSCSPGMRT